MKNLLITLSLLLAFSVVSHASNLRFIKDASMGKLTDEDWSYLKETVGEVLEYSEEGDEQSWENPKSGSLGVVKLRNVYQHDGLDCRRLLLRNTAKGEDGRQRFDFCKKDGAWKILNPAPKLEDPSAEHGKE